MKPKVVELNSHNYRQAAPTLREIANDIEAGKYGTVRTVAIVIGSNELSVFGCGPEAEAGMIHLTLHQGMNYLARCFEEPA